MVSGGQPDLKKRPSSSSRMLWPLRLEDGEESGEGVSRGAKLPRKRCYRDTCRHSVAVPV